MAFRRLTSTHTADLKPLGSAGQRSFELIRREAAALGPDHEALFAEPSTSPEGDVTDWYTSAIGTPRPLAEADADAQATGRRTLERLVADLQARADTLQQSRDPEKRRLGEALRNAVEIPDKWSVYLVGEQPVLVAWAHHRNTTAPPCGVLTSMVAASAPPPTAVAPAPMPPASAGPSDEPPTSHRSAVAVPGFGWLWWLLWGGVGALAAVLAWLLLPACGLSNLPGLNFCNRSGDVSVAEEIARHDLLQVQMQQLQRELGLARQVCVPEPRQRAAAEQPPAGGESDDFDERVQRGGGETDAALTVTLIWDTPSDLDLWVRCPTGGHISHLSPQACGGRLDIDQNAEGGSHSRRPVENIVFAGRPPAGQYHITVHNYQQRGQAVNQFRVRVRVGDEETLYEGRLSSTGERREFSFNVP